MITVEELEGAIALCFEMKDRVTAQKNILSQLQEQFDTQEQLVISMLESLQKDSYHSESGIFSWKFRESYQVPKDEINRERFFNHLKDRGAFDQLITVNSRTLNAWANQEIEAHGHLDYQIPGLVKGTPYPVATLRRK